MATTLAKTTVLVIIRAMGECLTPEAVSASSVLRLEGRTLKGAVPNTIHNGMPIVHLSNPLADNGAEVGEDLREVVGQMSPESAHEAHPLCRLLVPIEAMHGVLWLEDLL
jgi:hypothetical protein